MTFLAIVPLKYPFGHFSYPLTDPLFLKHRKINCIKIIQIGHVSFEKE